jgi:hypothetical protein
MPLTRIGRSAIYHLQTSSRSMEILDQTGCVEIISTETDLRLAT